MELRDREEPSKHDRLNFLSAGITQLANISKSLHVLKPSGGWGKQLLCWLWHLLPSQAASSPTNQPCSHPNLCPRLTLHRTPAHWIRADIQILEILCYFCKVQS